jgi:tocopherol cyclase
VFQRARDAYRRTGADLPGSDPRPSHGARMEGWFWRFTDRERGRVVVALCGINRHTRGTWSTVAVTAHPDGAQRSAVVPEGRASTERFDVRAGDVLEADAHHLRVDLDGVRIEVEIDDPVPWPHRVGAGGLGSILPGLSQYWHPHLLGGTVRGTLTVDGDEVALDGAHAYAEKNWGHGFPDRWWWGQSQGFADGSVCVAFGGGRVGMGPLGVDLTAAVLRLGDDVVRFSPPIGWVRASAARATWRVRAWRPLELDGDAGGRPPAALPVPVPAERRNVVRDLEHLAGRVHLRVHRWGELVLDDRSELGALEVGALDVHRFAELATEQGLVRP